MRSHPILALLLVAGCDPAVDPRTSCAGDSDCFRDERCASGVCVPASPAGPGGLLDAAADTGSSDAATGVDAPAGPDAGPDGLPDTAADAAGAADAPGADAAAGPDTGAADAGPADAGAADAGPDTQVDIAVPDASPGSVELVATARLSDVVASQDTFVDVGFCPEPSKVVSAGLLSGKAACDDAVFVRFEGTTGGSLQVRASTTRSGKTLASSSTLTAAASGTFTVTFTVAALPQDPTTVVPVHVAVDGSEGASLAWDTTTQTRWADRFGPLNLEQSVATDCVLSKELTGTLANVSVALDGDTKPLGELPVAATKGAFTKEDGWIQLVADRCAAQYLLLEVGLP